MGDFNNIDLQRYFQAGHTGFWKQEYEEGKHPRLYTDDIMDSLIGAEGDMTPEERFDFFAAHIHPQELECFGEYIAELKTHEAEVIYRYIHPVTGNMYVRCTGRPIQVTENMVEIIGYHQEVSDVMRFEPDKLLENRLVQQNQELKVERQKQDNYYKELLDTISCGVMSYTLPEHQIVHMNAEAMRIYGVDSLKEAQENIGRLVGMIVYSKSDTVEKLKGLRDTNDSLDYECLITGNKGAVTPVLAKTCVYMAPNGEKSVVTTFIDISENVTLKNEMKKSREYQKELQLSIQEAKRANIAKTDFLRRMSHDIRTPINGIVGMISIAEHYADDLEKQRECRVKVKEATSFLLKLINNILDMNKLESGNVILKNKAFDLVEELKEVNTITEMNAQEYGVSYYVDNSRIEHPYLIGSSLHLHQILQNLDGNALKYNRPGGSIHVSCREIGFADGKATYEFICEDTGLGMSEEFQKHAFEPFSQEKGQDVNPYNGTGLGLAITKQLVELMGGTITLDSKLGVGTKFTVVLTFEVDNSCIQSDRSGEKQPEISLEGIKVLLVEDNELNMEIARFILEKAGMEVTSAWNGQEGVEKFQKSEPHYFDVILMDVMMPIMDGLTAARTIRSLDRVDAADTPIFAMTANAFQEDMQRSKEAGMWEHLSKPLNEKEIYRMIGKYILK